MPKEAGDAVMKKMDEMNLPSVEDLFIMLIAEGQRPCLSVEYFTL